MSPSAMVSTNTEVPLTLGLRMETLVQEKLTWLLDAMPGARAARRAGLVFRGCTPGCTAPSGGSHLPRPHAPSRALTPARAALPPAPTAQSAAARRSRRARAAARRRATRRPCPSTTSTSSSPSAAARSAACTWQRRRARVRPRAFSGSGRPAVGPSRWKQLRRGQGAGPRPAPVASAGPRLIRAPSPRNPAAARRGPLRAQGDPQGRRCEEEHGAVHQPGEEHYGHGQQPLCSPLLLQVRPPSRGAAPGRGLRRRGCLHVRAAAADPARRRPCEAAWPASAS